MNSFIVDLVNSYVILIIFSVAIYLIGHFFSAFMIKRNERESLCFFMKLLTGLMAIVTVYSIYRTSFLTMYTGVLITFIFYLMLNKKRVTVKISKNLKAIEWNTFFYYLIALFIVCLSVTFLFYFDNRIFIHQDAAFYARIGGSLFENGVEVTNVEPFLYGKVSAGIYHYFNEWLISIFLHFSGFTSLKILLLLVIPLLATISLMGAYVISDKYLPEFSPFSNILVSLLFLLIPGILSFLVHVATTFNLNAPYSILQGGIVILKVKIVVILLLAFLINSSKKFYDNNFLPLILIPLIWNTMIPAFLGGYILYFVYSLYMKNPVSLKYLFYWLLPILYIPIYLKIANSIYLSKTTVTNPAFRYGLFDYLVDSYSRLSGFFYTTVVIVIGCFILFAFIILFYDKMETFLFTNREILITKPQKNNVILIISIAIAGIVSFGFMHNLFNARQIIVNLFYPLINILLFIFFLLLMQKSIHLKMILVSILFMFIIVHAIIYSPKTSNQREKLAEHFKMLNQNNCKMYFATDIAISSNAFLLYHKPYADLLMYCEDYKPIKLNIPPYNISNYTTPKEKIESRGGNGQIFTKYVIRNKLEGDIDKAKVNFLDEFDVDFLLVDEELRYSDTSYLLRLNIDTIVLFDERKNVYLIKLK